MISKDIHKYCKSFSEKDSQILQKIIEYTNKNEKIPQMISGPEVGNVLQLFAKLINAVNIIEVGMFTGYSALKMAQVLPNNGFVHTCELMEKHIQTAQSFFDQTEYGEKIVIHKGEASKTLEQFKSNEFDLAFIDADKINYLDYYQKCMVLIRPGGIIILDNMLWSGSVIDPGDNDSKSLRKTAEYISNDDRVENYLLTVRDGLMVCRKK